MKTTACEPTSVRPDGDGAWLWFEGDREPVELTLADDGMTVANADPDSYDEYHVTHQSYWEGMATDQKNMPGRWMRSLHQ